MRFVTLFMNKIVFVSFLKNTDFDRNICLLVSSIRNFTGPYANAPIWIMIPSNINEIDKKMKKFLNFQNCEFFPYEAHPMNVKKDFFPMKTHVDGTIIRPYFNAGFLVCRPEVGVLDFWKKNFLEFAYRDEFKVFYKDNIIYSIFIHQAILTACVLTKIKRKQLQELSFEYNYPIHLYHTSAKEFRPENISDLITVRFEEDRDLKFLKSHLDSKFNLWYSSIIENIQFENRF